MPSVSQYCVSVSRTIVGLCASGCGEATGVMFDGMLVKALWTGIGCEHDEFGRE